MEREINHKIGVLVTEDTGLSHDFFALIMDQFFRAISLAGYEMHFLNNEKECKTRKTLLQQVQDGGYDGVFVICYKADDEEANELLRSGMPILILDEDLPNVLSVSSDNKEGMRNLVEYIIEMGHKRIAFISGTDNTVSRIRLRTFLEVCKEHDIEIPTDYLKQGLYRDITLMSHITEQLLRLPDAPTCIIYPDDYAAIGGINMLHARGLDVPGDISIAGYDGLPVMSQYEPRLTTVVQDKVSMGRTAAEKLIYWIEHPDYKAEEPTIVPTQLEKGRSVGKIYY